MELCFSLTRVSSFGFEGEIATYGLIGIRGILFYYRSVIKDRQSFVQYSPICMLVTKM